MKKLPFDVQMDLEGWRLFWARLEVEREAAQELADLRQTVADSAIERFADTSKIGAHPTVSALRRLFRAAGCDPTRYRPASEALLRRLVKGTQLPAIHPLVDVNNCLSAELAVPCCVMVDGVFGTSLTWRAGRPGESYESLRGPFNLEGKPLLLDEEGPLDTPITGSQRVKVVPGTTSAWLVAYMPAAQLTLDDAWDVLSALCERAGIAAEPFDREA